MIQKIIFIAIIILFSPLFGSIERNVTNKPIEKRTETPQVSIVTLQTKITTPQPETPQIEPVLPQPTPPPKMDYQFCQRLSGYWYDNACNLYPKPIIINIEQETMPIQKITSEVQPEPSPTSSAVIEVIDAIPGKGLGRTYFAYDWDTFNNNNVPDSERPVGFVFPDESNYIDIGVIVRDEKGQSVKDAILKIEATDKTQNKEINGTGITKKMRDADGNVSEIASYYPYHYEFKTKGKHTLTFTSGEIILSVDIEVTEK